MLRAAIAWIVCIALWGLFALFVLFMNYVFHEHGLIWGLLVFAVFTIGADFTYRLMGYKRGIRDVP